MSKPSIAIAFLFFTLSFARTPLSEPENDITHLKIPDTHQEFDATPTTTLNQYDKETQHVQDIPEPKAKHVKALPLTNVRLRPINRHFRIGSRHPFRLCNHHNHHHAHNLNPRTHLDQIPYDEDMIHSSGENSDFEDVMLPEHMPQVQEEWMSFLHHNHHLHDDDDNDDEHKMSRFLIKRGNHDKFAKLKLKSQFYDPVDDDEDEDDNEDDKSSAMHEDHHSFDKKKLKKHLNHHHEEEEEQEAEEENESHKEEKKTGSFMKRIRKFLDPYLD